MYKILVATHGKMCQGMTDTIRLFASGVTNVTAIPFYTSELDGDRALEQYMAQIGKEDRVVVLTDIPGGSVNQKLFRYASGQIHVISGVNLPLLYGLALAQEEQITEEFIRQTIEQSKGLMQYMNDVTIKYNEGDE